MMENTRLYKSSNIQSFKLLLTTLLFFYVALTFSSGAGYSYVISQLAGALFFTQMFILLHECGHNSFFKTPQLNFALGQIAGLLTFIPFYNWQKIHNLHHQWTGYRDKDPTTEGTLNKPRGLVYYLANVSWRLFIPLFAIGYRFGIYWNIPKLKKHLTPVKFKMARLQLILFSIFYVVVFASFGSWLIKFLPAYILSLIFTELIILSQHSYINMPLAKNEKVMPMKPLEQALYTRSLHLPHFFAYWVLFNVNLHEAHHAYPTMPCYNLQNAKYQSDRTVNFHYWFFKAKKTPATDYVFNTKSDFTF